MRVPPEFYETDLGKKVSSIVQQTSMLLIDRCYELIPADNIKTGLTPGRITFMDEMLDHYFAKLLPWNPNKSKFTNIIELETVEGIIFEAPLFHEENGLAVDGDIYMQFYFGYNGSVEFEGIHY
ncbi:MAG: hypothetical protein FWG14_13735 [Peptococcaceae bacterium]|nr:hypothetical protein [Peptococcaceae bacterium]